MPLSRNEKILLGLLVLAAVAVRLHFAWIGQWSTDPDRGVASLMALHMAEGRAWPVFFYGQGYMGSVEPLVASLFCRLFGVSGFTVCLGTAIPAALLLLPLYLLARRVAGPLAGAGAAAFLVLGPDAFVAYMSSPRGGYAAILVLNTLVLLLAARMADVLWQKKALPYAEGFWLGLCGGLGWWVGPMVLPALGAAGLVLAVSLRGRVWHRSIVQATVAFFVGSAPWWIWNTQHNWLSLSMRKAVGGVSVNEALGVLAVRVWKLLGWPEMGGSAILLGGGFLLLTGLILWRAWRERGTEAVWAQAAVLLYTLIFVCAYSVSSFSRTQTMRYVLPVLPVLAVVVGVAGALAARVHRGLAVVVLLTLIGPPIYLQWTLPPEGTQEKKMVQAAPRFVDEVSQAGLDVVFAEYPWHWVNFATQGAVPVVEPAGDAVPLNDRAGLLARNPAYWPNGDFAHFFRRTLTRKSLMNTSLGRIYVEVRPAPDDVRVMSSARVVSLCGAAGEELSGLLDGKLTAAWSGESAAARAEPFVHLVLSEPTPLAGLMLFSSEDAYPLYAALEGREDADAPWQSLVAESYTGGWYWSGPQAYYRDLYYHLELRCAPTRVKELRLRLVPSTKRPSYAFQLSELVLLEATGGERKEEKPDVEAILVACRARGIQRLYAHRWAADRLAARALPDLAVDHSSRLDRGSSDVRSPRSPRFSQISAVDHTAFFCETAFLAHNQRMLEGLGHGIETVTLPGGVLLVVTTPAAQAPPLVWTGQLLLRGEP